MNDHNLPKSFCTTFNPLPLKEDWYLRHSTRAIWHKKKNVQADGSHDERKLASHTLYYSFQETSSSQIQTHLEKHFQVLGSGKDGKLESWMKETEWGIEDSSGEIRADGRSRWVLIYFPPSSVPPASAGIDILSSRPKQLADTTIQDIRVALNNMDDQFTELGKLEIFQVIADGGRDQERQDKRKAAHEKWEKRTGAAEGISPDLVYDEEEPRKSGKCIAQ